MAGVYPVGMKLAATWAKGRHGLDGRHPGRRAHARVGVAASVQRVRSASNGGFRSSCPRTRAFVAALLIRFRRHRPQSRADAAVRSARRVVGVARRPAAALPISAISATCGSSTRCGRGSGVFLTASFALTFPCRHWRPRSPSSRRSPRSRPAAIGSVAAGLLADRLGRTTITIDRAMAISGTCAATIGFLYGGDPGWLIAVCLVWGISIVADSGAVLGVDRGAAPIARAWARC